jgi:hypothetical protein
VRTIIVWHIDHADFALHFINSRYGNLRDARPPYHRVSGLYRLTYEFVLNSRLSAKTPLFGGQQTLPAYCRWEY